MSWLFSQALVEEYSAGTFSDGEPSAQWNVMPTQQGFWRNDKMMESSRLSRFGPTCRLLTEDHGAAVLMSFLAAFPVRTSASRGGGAGIGGERSGLWAEMARIIREVLPRFVFVENSPALTSRGLGRVLGDLAEMGFDARWGVLGAADLGAHHKRDRIWITANALHGGQWSHVQPITESRSKISTDSGRDGEAQLMADTASQRRSEGRPESAGQQGRLDAAERSASHVANSNSNSTQRLEPKAQSGVYRRPNRLHGRAGGTRGWTDWPPEPVLGRVVDGVAHRVDRIKALGNGQVPRVAAAAFSHLSRGEK